MSGEKGLHCRAETTGSENSSDARDAERFDTSTTFVLRAVIGGILAAPLCLIGLAIHEKLRTGRLVYAGGLYIVGLPGFLAIGCLSGFMTGIIIGIFLTKGITLPNSLRVVIGICVVLGGMVLLKLTEGPENASLVPPTPSEALVDGIIYIVTFGILPGLMAFSRKRQDKKS